MDFIIRPYESGEERYVANAHRSVYSAEYHWPEPFLQYAEQIPLKFAEKARNDREELWIAEADGKPVGSILLCDTDDPLTGQLRLFLVEREYRGRGIGSALLGTLMERARSSRYEKLTLLTSTPLTTAIRLYERLGFREIGREVNEEWSVDGEPFTDLIMEMTL